MDKSVTQGVGTFFVKHKSTFLMLGQIASTTGAIYFAIKDGQFILDTIADAREALASAESKEERLDIYKAAGKELAVPVGRIAAFYAGSIACSIGAKVDADKKDKQIAELTTALGLASNAIAQYKLWQEQAKKELGDEKVKQINTNVTQKVLPEEKEAPKLITDGEAVSGNHMYHYYDVWGSRDFWSERSPREVENFLCDSSYDLCDGNIDDDQFSMNDLYAFMHPGLSVGGGDTWGWTAEMARGRRTSDIINVRFSAMESRDRELMWQMDACPSPLFPRITNRY